MATRALAIATFLAVITASCAPMPPAYLPAPTREGVLRIYLQPLPQEAHRLSFSIAEILAVRTDGESIPLEPSFGELQGKDLIGLQRRWISATLPPGSYKGLSLRVGTASFAGEEGMANLMTPEEPLLIEREFDVNRESASALFLSLEPEKIVSGGFSFTPTFSLAKSRGQLKNLLGFATNTRSNVITVFNKHTMEVVDTIATRSGPMGAVLDPLREWLYVSLAGDSTISTIDVGSGQILRRARLHFGDEPVEIALSTDRRILVSANRGSNTASIIDADSLREIERVRLPSAPTSVVMSTVQPRAFLIQPLSSEITAIDLYRAEIVRTRTLEESPLRGAVSEDGDSLYVITKNSPNLLVLNPRNLNVIERIFVGSGAASIKVDPKTGLVYIGMKRGGVAVVDPSLLMRIDTFGVAGNAVFLDIDDDENSLLVVSSDRKAIRKMGLISQRVSGAIEVEEGCYAVVLMGGR